ncbi:hypothetical protein [Enterobacter sp.]|uniref:hypothetical protein n=1 Tax=Enterobacter sp. TaxID=42895 RepID=UPI00296F48EE|nr:hypothetical protein [Enterobacter sp.]
MLSKINYLIVAAFAAVICYLSWDLYLINSGDFNRAIVPFLNGVKAFTKNIPLIHPMRETFEPISAYGYKSSYSFIIYVYACLISLFTNTFDARILGSIFKVAYVFSLYVLFSNFVNKKGFAYTALFILASLLLVSSSNLAFFNSFYQEQVLLVCLPLICAYVPRSDNKALITIAIAMVIAASSKSQFFYLPLIVLSAYALFNRERILIKVASCSLALALSIACVMGSSGATVFNKYHANYFGVFEYAKNNGLELPDGVDDSCVGIDAWGNKFNITLGSERTKIAMDCYNRNSEYGFKDVLTWVAKNPSFLFKIPYDAGVTNQLTEDYFHVYKVLRLLVNDDGPLSYLTKAKDYLFERVKFTVLLITMIISLLLLKHRHSGVFFFISSFGISQMYVAFLGEGYRDLDKHLFGMNLSFDLVVFLLISLSAIKLHHLVKMQISQR